MPSTLHVATATRVALEDIRQLSPGRSGLSKHGIQNVDSNDTMFLLESATEPAPGVQGHPIRPGDWFPNPLHAGSGDYKVWVWSNGSCKFLLRDHTS